MFLRIIYTVLKSHAYGFYLKLPHIKPINSTLKKTDTIFIRHTVSMNRSAPGLTNRVILN